MKWTDKSVLVTGGTGSFGKMFTQCAVKKLRAKQIVIFSRDELKQHEMRQAGFDHPSIRYVIGDVRDRESLLHAMRGVDVVVHAAALKQVPACEWNPMEAIKTNILGTSNVIEAALDADATKVLNLSTDKAVNPESLYGATKLAAEKLVVQFNACAVDSPTRYACLRYGNVMGSRGSVIPVFLRQRESGRLTVTDERMTRFFLSLHQSVEAAIGCIEQMHGGEVFVAKAPSMKLMDLARAIAPDAEIDVVGIRRGEKLHDVLISEHESAYTIELDDMFVILPAEADWCDFDWASRGKGLPEGYRYGSETNQEWLDIEQLQRVLPEIEQSGSITQFDLSGIHET